MRCSFVMLFFLATTAQAQTVDSSAIERMTEAAHLWSQVKWVSPSIANGDVDWDKALVDALPKFKAATTESAMTDAITTLMSPLHDPAFQVAEIDTLSHNYVDQTDASEILEWLPDDVALLHLHKTALLQSDSAESQKVFAVIPQIRQRAKSLIIDLRPAKENAGFENSSKFLNDLVSNFTDRSLVLPSERYQYHAGYKPEIGEAGRDVFSAGLTVTSLRIIPMQNARAIPMVFIVNEMSFIPYVALALQRAGKAWILAEGKPSAAWCTPLHETIVDGKINVIYSVAELIFSDGMSGFGVDATVPADPTTGERSPAVQAAIKLMQTGVKPGAAIAWKLTPAFFVQQTERSYSEMKFPTLPWRQFAVIKLWATMDNFFPAIKYADHPWKDTLSYYIARMGLVKDGREYAQTLAEMTTKLDDNHASFYSPELNSFAGEAPAGLRLAKIEGRIVITEILADDLKTRDVLKVGDKLVEVDGEDVFERIKKNRNFIAGSNEPARMRDTLRYLLNGPDASQAKILIEDSHGKRRVVLISRSTAFWKFSLPKRVGAIVKILPANIGYVDLDRLENKDVEAMFESIKNTNSLILDMRGYPHVTYPGIAPRLNVNGAKYGAIFIGSVVAGVPAFGDTHSIVEQPIPKTDKPLYRGKVVMLINENTQSQAEHSGLFFEAATPITFIGTPSAGADGDISNIALPGGISVSFSGYEVRHADGRQLQRVGLQPDIKVAPTIKGIRAGRDEVLERAVAFLKGRHRPPNYNSVASSAASK